MHLHERTRLACDQRTADKLIDILDEVASARHLVDAAFLASEAVPKEYANALTTLLAVVSDRLKEVCAHLEGVARAEVSADAV